MLITVNGIKKEISANMTFAQLLSEMNIDSRKVAVERNLHLVKRTTFNETAINDGDEIEIINFVGGG